MSKARRRRRRADAANHARQLAAAASSGSGVVQSCPFREGGLTILRHTGRFAPGYEDAQVVFRALQLFGATFTVTVECSRDAEFDTVAYIARLPAANSTDYLEMFEWRGRGNQGTMNNVWLSPIHSPLRVTITSSGEAPSTASVQILIQVHSLRIRLGRWCPNEVLPDRGTPAWVRLKLNELGYFGGPVAENVHGYQGKAVTRYRSQHQNLRAASDGTLNEALYTALAAGNNRRSWITTEQSWRLLWEMRQQIETDSPLRLDDDQKRIRINVEASVYQEQGATDELRDQYENAACDKTAVEQNRFNRPIVPLECDIFLWGADDNPVRSRVVQGVSVKWSFEEPHEDLSRQHADDDTRHSYPRRYIRLAKEMNACGPDDRFNNCPQQLGGVRGADDWRDLFLTGGTIYPPYRSETHAESRSVFSHFYTGDDYESCRSRTGILFRPSFIAGDAYRVTATLSFFGNARRAALESANRNSSGAALCDRTNAMEIWRQARVAAVVGWPTKSDVNAEFWRIVEREYERCYVDLDCSNVATCRITDVVDNTAYARIVAPLNNQLRVFDADSGKPDNQSVTAQIQTAGLVAFSQPWNSGSSALQAMAFDLQAMYDETARRNGAFGFHQRLYDPYHTAARNRYANGMIVLHYSAVGAIQIVTGRGMLGTRTRAATLEDTNGQGAVSLGMPDGLVYVCQETPGLSSFAFTHEMAHCFWLRHKSPAPDPGPDHDHTDDYCMMTYPDFESRDSSAWNHPTNFNPRFCGRCNLKLRGWNVAGDRIPDASGDIVKDEAGMRKLIPYADMVEISSSNEAARQVRLGRYAWIRGAALADRIAVLERDCGDSEHQIQITNMPKSATKDSGRGKFRLTRRSAAIVYSCANHGDQEDGCMECTLEDTGGTIRQLFRPSNMNIGCYSAEGNTRTFIGICSILGLPKVVTDDDSFFDCGNHRLSRIVSDSFAFGAPYYMRFEFKPDYAKYVKNLDQKMYDAARRYAAGIEVEALFYITDEGVRASIQELSRLQEPAGKLGVWWRNLYKRIIAERRTALYDHVSRVHNALFTAAGSATAWDQPVWTENVRILETVKTFIRPLQRAGASRGDSPDLSSSRQGTGSSGTGSGSAVQAEVVAPALTPGGNVATRLDRLACLLQDRNTCGQRAVFNVLKMVANPHDPGHAQAAMNDDAGLRAIGVMGINIDDNAVRTMLDTHGGGNVALVSRVQHITLMRGDPTFAADAGDTAIVDFMAGRRPTLHMVVNTLAPVAQASLSAASGTTSESKSTTASTTASTTPSTAPSTSASKPKPKPASKSTFGSAQIGHYLAIEFHNGGAFIDVTFADSLLNANRTALVDALLNAMGLVRQ